MKKVLVDYKGKHYVIQDEDSLDEAWDEVVGEITEEQLTDHFLEGHVDACMYYGIPAYIGGDKELNKRIDNLLKKYE
jgi:hypothetical protein